MGGNMHRRGINNNKRAPACSLRAGNGRRLLEETALGLAAAWWRGACCLSCPALVPLPWNLPERASLFPEAFGLRCTSSFSKETLLCCSLCSEELALAALSFAVSAVTVQRRPFSGASGFLKTQCLWASDSQIRAGFWNVGSDHRLAILEMAGTGIFSLFFQLKVELICERTS
uniref:Uncharacterized protein n=1 Tax=Pipistrellus kuhlii TaxID=59472 RepID=A0A7J7UGE3_PIPKU|nr:hypothetical protein mPipKuh1_009060 [Pipistrellus kuhlii]